MVVNSEEVLRDVLLAAIKEQRARRRWNIFFRFLFLAVIALLLAIFFSDNSPFSGKPQKFTAVVNVNGIIGPDQEASADKIVSGLDDAFKDTSTKGIVLRINSPGGTPVQASQVYNEIMRQRALHPNIKVYAVCNDMCTSAAYYIASAADAIYANPSSLVGSIGVLMEGFGFTDAIQKLGVQRRLMISGDYKGFLDPFSPLKPQDVQMAQTMLDIVHEQFIRDVEKGRGARLKVNQNTFSGLVFTGQQALSQGLIDGFGSTGQVAREVIKAERIEDFTVKSGLLGFFADRIGASFAHHLAAVMENPQLK
jgi:protease-4